jgi:hypothetical protein
LANDPVSNETVENKGEKTAKNGEKRRFRTACRQRIAYPMGVLGRSQVRQAATARSRFQAIAHAATQLLLLPEVLRYLCYCLHYYRRRRRQRLRSEAQLQRWLRPPHCRRWRGQSRRQ